MSDTENLLQKLKQTELAYYSALEMSQFKAGFLGRIAHELRSPLSSLMGLQQLIISDLAESPEEERELIGKSYEYTKKLLILMDRLVEISKIETGRLPLELQELKVSKILATVETLTHLQAANRNLKLEIYPCQEQLLVMVDEQKICQSLVNLLEVIIEHTDIGTIALHGEYLPDSEAIAINIDAPIDIALFSEPLDSITSIADRTNHREQNPHFSQGMKVMLAQNLLEIMGGKLQVQELELSSYSCAKHPIRLQCLLPPAP